MQALEILKALAKELTTEIKFYDKAGKVGYSEIYRKVRRKIYLKIEEIEKQSKIAK